MTTGTLIELQANLKALNLSSMARNLDATLRQAREGGIDYDEFLLELTAAELRGQGEKQSRSPDQGGEVPSSETHRDFRSGSRSGTGSSAFSGSCRRQVYSGAQERHFSGTKWHWEVSYGYRPGNRSL